MEENPYRNMDPRVVVGLAGKMRADDPALEPLRSALRLHPKGLAAIVEETGNRFVKALFDQASPFDKIANFQEARIEINNATIIPHQKEVVLPSLQAIRNAAQIAQDIADYVPWYYAYYYKPPYCKEAYLPMVENNCARLVNRMARIFDQTWGAKNDDFRDGETVRERMRWNHEVSIQLNGLDHLMEAAILRRSPVFIESVCRFLKAGLNCGDVSSYVRNRVEKFFDHPAVRDHMFPAIKPSLGLRVSWPRAASLLQKETRLAGDKKFPHRRAEFACFGETDPMQRGPSHAVARPPKIAKFAARLG